MGERSQDRPVIIPFGTDTVTSNQVTLTETADGVQFACRLPHVIIDPADRLPLRLNSGGLEFGDPPPVSQMPEISDQLAYLLTHFQLYCTVWDKFPRAFLDRYFAFIHDQVTACREELEQSLSRFGDLYRFEEWAFSALRPLPRAHLWAPENSGIPDFDVAHLLRVDLAFWTGMNIIAIDIIGTETRGEKHAARKNRLTGNGVTLIEIPHDILAEDRKRDFAAGLPPAFHRFWESEALPAGPFKSAPLPARA